MKDNSFEKQISEKLSQAKVQPSEGLLNSIFEKRASKPKGFAGIGYSGLVLAAVLVVSFTAFSLMYWRNDNVSEHGSIAGSHENAKDKSTPEVIKPESITQSNTSDDETSMTEKNAPNVPKTATTSKSLTRNEIKKAKRDAQLIRNPELELIKNQEPKLVSSLVDGNARIFENYSDYFNTNANNRPKIDQEYHNGNSHLYVFETANDEDIAKFGILFTRQGKLKKKHLVYEKENIDFATKEKVSEGKKFSNKSPLFIDILLSPSLNTHRSVGNSELSKVSNGMTKMNTNLQTGIRISKPISKQFNIFSGLFYNTISNAYLGKIAYSSDEVKINKNVRYINDPVNGVIQVITYDTVNYVAQNTQNIDYKNKYQMFQVPIGFSYNFGYKSIDFSLHGSALFNVIKSSKGYVLNTELHNSEAFESSEKIIGLGAGFSIMSAYRISPKFRLILEPGFQYYGINSKKAGNNINEKTFNTQLTIGLRYTVF
jgi:hypothetical protein